VPIRRDSTGLAGDDVGQEIDLLTNFHLSAHQDLLFGFSKLFAGTFWRQTGPSGDPQLFDARYTFRWQRRASRRVHRF
jgi:hypothetical protein